MRGGIKAFVELGHVREILTFNESDVVLSCGDGDVGSETLCGNSERGTRVKY